MARHGRAREWEPRRRGNSSRYKARRRPIHCAAHTAPFSCVDVDARSVGLALTLAPALTLTLALTLALALTLTLTLTLTLAPKARGRCAASVLRAGRRDLDRGSLYLPGLAQDGHQADDPSRDHEPYGEGTPARYARTQIRNVLDVWIDDNLTR